MTQRCFRAMNYEVNRKSWSIPKVSDLREQAALRFLHTRRRGPRPTTEALPPQPGPQEEQPWRFQAAEPLLGARQLAYPSRPQQLAQLAGAVEDLSRGT